MTRERIDGHPPDDPKPGELWVAEFGNGTRELYVVLTPPADGTHTYDVLASRATFNTDETPSVSSVSPSVLKQVVGTVDQWESPERPLSLSEHARNVLRANLNND